jgi:EmrB/QacA subfamily drug resistance transporter
VADPRRWLILALLCAAFFMVVLDVSIVNVALPSIEDDLHFSRQNLQWVVSAYALAFGSLLLLAGRGADRFGRRIVFMAGVTVFTAASLACGLATSGAMLIAARALQGVGSAMLAPSALSIITTVFPEGAEENKALGIWGAMGGAGAAGGVLLGGALTEYLGWEWIFFVNVPVGAAVVGLARLTIRDRHTVEQHPSFDIAGAATITGSLVLTIYTLVNAQDEGWSSLQTILQFVGAAVLMAAFVVIESRSPEPLVPFRIFKIRSVAGADVATLALGAALFSMFLLLSLYMQVVLGYSAVKTGLCYLGTVGPAIAASAVAQGLVTKVGVKPILLASMSCLTGGLIWLTQIGSHSAYWADLFPGFVLIGIGISSFVPASIAALQGVPDEDSGLASGLLNTAEQVGGALGVAVLATVFSAQVDRKLGHLFRPATPDEINNALTSGFTRAFWVGAGIAAAGIVAVLALIRWQGTPSRGTARAARAQAQLLP